MGQDFSWAKISSATSEMHGLEIRPKAWFPFTAFAYHWRYFSSEKNISVEKLISTFLEFQRKLVWSSIMLVLRMYWGLSSLRPDKAVGRSFCENFLILGKCLRDSRSLIGFAVRQFRTSWNIWTSNTNRAEDIFSSCSIRFTVMRMSHTKNFAGNKRKAWVEIRLKCCCEKYWFLDWCFWCLYQGYLKPCSN